MHPQPLPPSPMRGWWRLAIYLLVLAVPGVLICGGLVQQDLRRDELQRRCWQRELSKVLERYVPLADPWVYLGRLLEETCARSEAAPRPLAELKRRLARLKRVFPGTFSFVVWDAQGALEQEGTDLKGYQAVLKRLGNMLREIAARVDTVAPRELMLVPEIAGQINLVKSLMGRFFVPSQLTQAYRRDGEPPLIRVDYDTERALLWHRFGKAFGMLAFITEAGGRSGRGLELSLDAFNRRSAASSSWRLALIDPREPERFIAQCPDVPAREILQAVGQDSTLGQDVRETTNVIVGTRLLNDGRILVAFQPRAGRLSELSQKILPALGWVLLGYVLLGAVAGIGFRYSHVLFSIRVELPVLFLFASGVPLGMLAMSGNEYLETWRESRVFSLQQEAERFFAHVDREAARFLAKFSDRLRGDVRAMESRDPAQRRSREVFDALVAAVADLRPKELYLFAPDGQCFHVCPGRTQPAARQRSWAQAGAVAIDILRTGVFPANTVTGPDSMTYVFSFDDVVNAMLFRTGQFWPLVVGVTREWVYSDRIHFADESQPTYLWLAIWNEQTVCDTHLRECLPALRKALPDLRIGAFGERGRPAFRSLHVGPSWQKLVETARRRGRVFFQGLRAGGQEHAGIALVSQKFPETVYLASIADSRIQQQQDRRRRVMIAAGLAILGLGLAIGLGLSQEFLRPLRRIERSALAIREKVFVFEPEPGVRDELGDLEQTFAHMVGSLQELELAKIVQEALLPTGTLECGRVRMCGGSAAVTELGGDYFDLIDHGSGKVTVILGDAAGHGVPAALIMAIVKAAIFLEDDLWERPLDVLQRIHEQLYALQGKPRKLMTLQLLNLDGTSGLGRLANAGQAYPFLLQNGTATLVEVPSRPLGVFRRASLNSCNIRLNPGDYLVMYSDGMVEALMPTGEMVGYDRCLELAAHTARFPATEFYAALRAGHRQLAPTLADDATFVVVGLAPEEPVGRMAEGAPA